MRPTLLSFSATALMFVPLSAFAQIGTNITINIPELNVPIINVEAFDENGPIPRMWSAIVPPLDTYEFEIIYEQSNRTASAAVGLVDLESGSNEGIAISSQSSSLSIRPRDVMQGIDTDAAPEGTALLEIAVFRRSDPDNMDTSATNRFEFNYDLLPPNPPIIVSVSPGEDRLEISWEAPNDGDIEMYEVVYVPDIGPTCPTSITTVVAAELTESYGLNDVETSTSVRVSSPIGVSQRTAAVSEALTVNRCAAVGVRSIDAAGNRGRVSNLVIATPIEVFDFFEYHRETSASPEDGGFCFIATAAYGSYAHPAVRVLRGFRDNVLKRTPFGTALVWSYYRLSPPLAAKVARDPLAASAVRLALVPVTLGAGLLLLLPFVALAALLVMLLRRRWQPVATVAIALLVVSVATPAEAHRTRGKSRAGWGLSFKGGPYLPALGNVELAGATPVPRDVAFNNVFGPDAGANALYTLGLDLQLYRGFGRAGIGGGFGFMQFVGRGIQPPVPTDGSAPTLTGDTTVFNILPLTLVGFYRFDWLSEEYGIPFIPYVRAGLAYYVWWVTNGNGDVSRSEEGTEEVIGRGGKPGLTGTLGMALSLDWLDPNSAAKLDSTTGITGTQVFAEIEADKVDGFGGDGFDFSDVTWNIGLYLEF